MSKNIFLSSFPSSYSAAVVAGEENLWGEEGVSSVLPHFLKFEVLSKWNFFSQVVTCE